jgi:hypothetical protein
MVMFKAHVNVKVLSKIGRDLAAIFKDTNTEHVCRELATNAEWSHRLAKLKVCVLHCLNGLILNQ